MADPWHLRKLYLLERMIDQRLGAQSYDAPISADIRRLLDEEMIVPSPVFSERWWITQYGIVEWRRLRDPVALLLAATEDAAEVARKKA